MKKRTISAVLVLSLLFTLLTGCQTVSTVQNAAASAEPTVAQAADDNNNFSEKEALNAVRQTINLDYSKYHVDLVSDSLQYDGQSYYQFQIADSRAAMQPYLIVSKENGAVYCYYMNHTVSDVSQDKVFGSKC